MKCSHEEARDLVYHKSSRWIHQSASRDRTRRMMKVVEQQEQSFVTIEAIVEARAISNYDHSQHGGNYVDLSNCSPASQSEPVIQCKCSWLRRCKHHHMSTQWCICCTMWNLIVLFYDSKILSKALPQSSGHALIKVTKSHGRGPQQALTCSIKVHCNGRLREKQQKSCWLWYRVLVTLY